jgi:hypothetical protein
LNNITTFLFVGLAFVVGSSVHLVLSYAQNTTTYAPVVQSSDALITSITGIVIAIAGLITVLVKSGLIDKKVGTVAVMAADAAVAVKDNRQSIKDLSQNTYDVVKLASPETAAAADAKLAPVLDEASRRVAEYTPKVDKFADLASKISNKGKTADDKIEEMKDDIPDRIVPS